MTRSLPACVLAAALGAFLWAPAPAQQISPRDIMREYREEPEIEPQPIPLDFVSVSKKVLPNVANLAIVPREDAQDIDDPEFNDQLLRYLLEQRPDINPWGRTATGSGVLIKRDGNIGYILTNHHVIAPLNRASYLKLTFHRDNGKIEISGDQVRVIGRDRLSDLAVVEFEIPEQLDVSPVPFGDSTIVEVGQWVMALGSPLDLQNSVSKGIISNTSRTLQTNITVEPLLQTDATIQPGNSGGPLVNMDGEIIGIVNAIASNNGLWQGIGFAIPSRSASEVADQLIEMGRVPRGYLGVTMATVITLGPQARRDYGLPNVNGVLIDKIVRNSPADVAGLQVRDVVTAIDGAPLTNNEEMLRIISMRRADDQIKLDVVRLNSLRQPEQYAIEATLAERPSEDVLQMLHDDRQNFIIPVLPLEDGSGALLGLKLVPEIEGNAAGLRILEIAPSALPGVAELQLGDLVLSVNGRRVRSIADFEAALAHPIAGSHSFRYLRAGEIGTAVVDG